MSSVTTSSNVLLNYLSIKSGKHRIEHRSLTQRRRDAEVFMLTQSRQERKEKRTVGAVRDESGFKPDLKTFAPFAPLREISLLFCSSRGKPAS